MTVHADEADFRFSCTGVPAGELKVLSFKGKEALSQCFSIELMVVSQSSDLALDELVGASASLTLSGLSGHRELNGILESISLVHVGRKFSHYSAVLVPSITPLGYTRNSRIFQQQTVPDIVAQVLREAGIPAEASRWALMATYQPLDYCVQFQESDLAFICRLLEDEGIFFFFQHVGGRDILVLADGKHAMDPVAPSPHLEFQDEARAAVLEQEIVYHLEGRASITAGRVTLRDFRFKQPSLDMEVHQEASSLPGLERYYFPGEYVEPAVGRRLVKLRLEEQVAFRHTLTGRSNCRRLLPGHVMELTRHPRRDFNQALQLVEVEHEAHQPQSLQEEAGIGQVESTSYVSRFVCLPLTVPYRPPRLTPHPIVHGLQSATVVGPLGEEIHCDEFGRVKVQFHWDREGKRNEHSSCWIRVNQPWAGPAFGALFLPRIGQEVLVQCLEGDPDRPVIVGRVYNGANPVPYPLPAHKTRSTLRTESTLGGGGFNELRFEDLKGQEEIFLHAQKDWNTQVLHDLNRQVHHDQSQHVGHDRTRHVGHDETVTVDNDRRTRIKGHESLTVDKTRIEMVTGDRTRRVLKGDDATVIEQGKSQLTVQKDRSVVVRAGNESLTVEQGNSTQTIKGSRVVRVQSGNEARVVETGSSAHTVKQNLAVTVQSGNSTHLVETGTLTLSAAQRVTLESSEENVDVSAEQVLILHGSVKVSMGSDKVVIAAKTSITLSVGASSIELKPEGITISAPALTSSAIGLHEISGALIRVN